MLKNLLKITLVLTPILGFGQSKYNLGAELLVKNYQEALRTMGADCSESKIPATLLVKVEGDKTINEIESLGGIVKSVRNNVAIVEVSVGKIDAIAALSGVVSIDAGEMKYPMLVNARSETNADQVLDGSSNGLTQAYTGAGVITGLMDQGIDPNHVAFYNSDQTESRVKAVHTYMSKTVTGSPDASYLTAEEIANFKTDNSTWTHGTHVASIMSGGYNGVSNYALNGKKYEGSPMPYYGLAGNSDIVMCGGYLYDDNILDGVEKVIDYAKSVDKPAVVNLSLGSVVGPHDGSSSFSQYLAGLGEDAIIVVAAGNDADKNCALNYSFNRLSPSVKTGISILDTSSAAVAEFWYSTSDAFKFEFIIHNKLTGAEVATFEIPETGAYYKLDGSDENFAAAFGGSSVVYLYANVDPNNDRYYVQLQLQIVASQANDNYVPAVRITGTNGKKLNATISNGEFSATGISGGVSGTANGSISDMATGDNIISVGAFTSSKSFTLMNGGMYSYNGSTEVGELCSFSSYGISFDGVKYPDLCAPGSAIIAAVSRYAYPSPTTDNYSAEATFADRKNYWAVMQGTSMACPFVSGTVALMLEADPTLTVDEVRSILLETAIAAPEGATSDQKVQWGAGRIDVLAAIKKVLDDKSSVGAILADEDRNFIMTPADGGYNVYVAGESSLAVTVYDATGRVVAAVSAEGNSVDVATEQLTPGVYIVAAQGATQRHTAKIAVK